MLQSTSQKQEVGQRGEQITEDYLRSKGYVILAKNYRTRFGEIDLVAKDKETLVFIEVKTRRTSLFGKPEESITRKKIRHLLTAIAIFLARTVSYRTTWRFDVITITFSSSNHAPLLTHLRDIPLSLDEC